MCASAGKHPKPQQGAPRGALFPSNHPRIYATGGTGATAGAGVSVTT